MKIFNTDAAQVLFEKVKALATQPHNSWRCIYLNLSDKRVRHNLGLRTHFITQAIADLLSDADGNIYLCDDGDVFILFQGTLKPVLAKLSRHFEDIKLAAQNQQADSPFMIFDLSKYWQVFFNLCRAKSRNLASA